MELHPDRRAAGTVTSRPVKRTCYFLATPNLPTPVTVNITLAPEGARSDDLDDYAPATHPRNAIEAAIHDTIANTPTPSALRGTTLDRLAAPQPEGS